MLFIAAQPFILIILVLSVESRGRRLQVPLPQGQEERRVTARTGMSSAARAIGSVSELTAAFWWQFSFLGEGVAQWCSCRVTATGQGLGESLKFSFMRPPSSKEECPLGHILLLSMGHVES